MDCSELDKQLLIDNRIAHIALWSMSHLDNRARTRSGLASSSSFYIFKYVYDVAAAGDAPQAWLSMIVTSVGASDLMSTLRMLIFGSLVVDEVLMLSIRTLRDLAFTLPEQCGVKSTMSDASHFLKQCTMVLLRQKHASQISSQSYAWLYEVAVWEQIYELQLYVTFLACVQ